MAAGASQLPTAMAYQSQLIIKHWERQTDLARTSAPTSPPLPQGSLSPPPHHARLQGALVSAPPFLRHSEWGWGSTQPQSPPHSLLPYHHHHQHRAKLLPRLTDCFPTLPPWPLSVASTQFTTSAPLDTPGGSLVRCPPPALWEVIYRVGNLTVRFSFFLLP